MTQAKLSWLIGDVEGHIKSDFTWFLLFHCVIEEKLRVPVQNNNSNFTNITLLNSRPF